MVLNPSAAQRPSCVAARQCAFYIAALSIILSFLDFVSGNLALTGFQLLTLTSDFHCFGALGVRPGARTRPHVLAWHMGVIIAIVEPRS